MSSKEKIQQILNKAWKSRSEGDYNQSKQLLEEAQSLCQAEDLELLGRLFHIYMQHEYDHGNLTKALELNKKSISFYTQAKNQDKIAHAIRHRADLQNSLGQTEKSKANYLKAINIYRSKPDSHKWDLANALRGFGLLMEKRKMFEKAILIWEEVRDLYNENQFSAGIAEANSKIDQLRRTNTHPDSKD